MPLEKLKRIARRNLRTFGQISWLERKSKVHKYMQKKYLIVYQLEREEYGKKKSIMIVEKK
jgi:hypothetical protein